ncbi:MAG: hypothetical protein JXB26_08040 [Candidatus Aminicenantes bacterium]|nr:hypothetical protein [Candidatus Aminicenantes bacterium]
MNNKLSGLYLLAGSQADPASSGWESFGRFSLRFVPGSLVSVSTFQGKWLGVDGIITGIDRNNQETDADAALRLVLKKGINALYELSGYFTLLFIEKKTGRALLISDMMATRPYYIYNHGGTVYLGPDVSFPARIGLPLTMNRQVLYQMFRINHPLGGRCLAQEIERTRPFTSYEISDGGLVKRKAPLRIEQMPDQEKTLDQAADDMHETASKAVAAILEHPIARSRDLELPLTAGYDSRHLLAELMDAGRPPDRIRHVRVDEADYFPVEDICRDLKYDLHAPRFEDLDQKNLIRLWLRRTSGQIHLHQLYLFGVAPSPESRPVLGLTAYLSGLLFSYQPLGTSIHRRHYTRTGLALLFPDRERHAREFKEQVHTEISRFEGEEPFKKIAVDAVNRSPRYAGAVFAEFGERAFYIPPAADRATWEWFLRVPASLVFRQKARRRLFERHFPTLGAYPLNNGYPLIRSRTKKTVPFLSGKAPKREQRRFPRNAVPPTPHAWLRVLPILHRMIDRIVHESALCDQGEINRSAVRFLWKTHQLGAFNGWALMSFVTTEASHRIIIHGEDADSVADWLTD